MTVNLCFQCLQINHQPTSAEPQNFPHLHHFFIYEPDEFLTFYYHLCLECHQLWHEYHSTYHQDYDWHWETQSWTEFLRRYQDKLPIHLESTAQFWHKWALAQTPPFDASPPFRL